MAETQSPAKQRTMKENKKKQPNSKVPKMKDSHMLDPLTPSPPQSKIISLTNSTPSESSPGLSATPETASVSDLTVSSSTPEFSPALSASSETASVPDLTSSSAIVPQTKKDGAVDVSVRKKLLMSPVYELSEDKHMDSGLVKKESVVEHLKEARSQVLMSKDLHLSSKKLLDKLIEVIISEEFCGMREDIDWSPEILSTKCQTMILLFWMLMMVVACAVFFWRSSTQSYFNGPLPT